MMYRLFIDFPISASSTEDAVIIARKICDFVVDSDQIKDALASLGVEQINYRLGHDEDRQNRNYFVITDSGHASTKKTRVFLQKNPDPSV